MRKQTKIKLKGYSPRHLCRSVKKDRVEYAKSKSGNARHNTKFIHPRSKRRALLLALKSK